MIPKYEESRLMPWAMGRGPWLCLIRNIEITSLMTLLLCNYRQVLLYTQKKKKLRLLPPIFGLQHRRRINLYTHGPVPSVSHLPSTRYPPVLEQQCAAALPPCNAPFCFLPNYVLMSTCIIKKKSRSAPSLFFVGSGEVVRCCVAFATVSPLLLIPLSPCATPLTAVRVLSIKHSSPPLLSGRFISYCCSHPGYRLGLAPR